MGAIRFMPKVYLPPMDDAGQALFAGLIDHAPTFPPAQLPLDEGLAEHRRVRGSKHGWIVNRFVCPASKLPELGDEPLRLSVVVDTGELPAPDPRIEAVEAAGIDPGGALRRGSGGLLRAAASRRCLVPDPPDRRARAAGEGPLRRCDGAERAGARRTRPGLPAARDPFKATAGLHHPLRAGDEHGFLNLLAAAVFGDEEEALTEEERPLSR